MYCVSTLNQEMIMKCVYSAKIRSLGGIVAMVLALCVMVMFFSSCTRHGNEEVSELSLVNDDDDVFSLVRKNSLREGVHYISEVQIKDVKNTIEIWVMGDRVKSAIINNSKATVVITDGTYMVTYVSDEKTGIRMKLDGENAHKVFFNPAEDIAEDSLRILRREQCSGTSCVVVKAKIAFDGSDCTLWIDESNGFIKRMEALSENGEPMVVENRDVTFGVVADAEFSVPSEIVIEELM